MELNISFFYPNNFSKISCAVFGFVLPHVFFINCPIKNQIVVVFPSLYCWTIVGFSSRICFAISSISLLSIAGASNHFSLMISSADLPVDSISCITTLS